MPERSRLEHGTEKIAQKRKYSKLFERESMELYKQQLRMLHSFGY